MNGPDGDEVSPEAVSDRTYRNAEADGSELSAEVNWDRPSPHAELESEIIAVSRLQNLAVAESEVLHRNLKRFSREMMVASGLGVLSIAIAAYTIAIYRQPSEHIPFLVAVFSGAALLLGVTQVGYVVYQLSFGTGSDARNTLNKLSLFIASAGVYRESIQREQASPPKRIVLKSERA